MNKRQKVTLLACLAAFLLATLVFTPWAMYRRDIRFSDSMAYSPLWNPPMYGKLAFSFLLVEWAVIVVAGSTLMFLFKDGSET